MADLLPELRAASGAPVYALLRDAVTALVLDGRIATEVRLPSERELAAALGLSRTTVTAAYDALRASGFLASRTGSGSFVTVPPGLRPRPSLARWRSDTARSGDAPDGGGASALIDLSCAALPAPAGLLEQVVGAAAAELPRYSRSDGYEPAGLAVLRSAVADRFTSRGLPTDGSQIMITNGAMHALDLVLQLLVGPGDRVLTELPTYPGAMDGIRRTGARPVAVPLTPGGGWDVATLRATLRQSAPRLAYLIPDFHNPTGALVDDDARREVVRAARATGTTVVVDESFVELGLEPADGLTARRPTAAIEETVVTVGSLSKPVWGGLRIGWIRASADLVDRLTALRASIDMGGAVLDQLVAVQIMPRLDALMPARIAMVRERRDALLAALRSTLPGWRVVIPRGGLSMWVELDRPASTALSLLAPEAGVVVVPGSRFGIDGTLERFLRLPYALPVAQLETAVTRIAEVWRGLEHAPTALPARRLVVA